MQFYSLPSVIRGLVFDIDKTLYDNDYYAKHQIDLLIERLAEERSQTVAEASHAVLLWQQEFAAVNGGARQSLGNTFAALGIPMETSVAWREELIHPEHYLTSDEYLVRAIEELSHEYRIIAVTNNPVRVGRATLEVLGVSRFFPHVVGLDSTHCSKPDPAGFRHAAPVLECEPQTVVSVGDRYDVDIVPALSLGMGGVLVESVLDVYSLPRALAAQSEAAPGGSASRGDRT